MVRRNLNQIEINWILQKMINDKFGSRQIVLIVNNVN